MKYSEKLQDPRWQRVRLKVLERDGFKCLCCQSDKKSLQVHHLIYRKGDEPWDAPPENLETLCRDCHEWREDFNSKWEGRSLHPTVLCRVFEQVFMYQFSGMAPYTALNPLSIRSLADKSCLAWKDFRDAQRKAAGK